MTDQCNLRCEHCYFFEQEQEGTLDADGWERRDAVLDQLLVLKQKKYGDFIAMPERVLELMKSHNAKRVTDNCIFEKKGYSLTTTGQVKEKCMLGPKADCDRCGCVVPYYLHYRVEKSTIVKATWNEVKKRARLILSADATHRSSTPPNERFRSQP